MPVGPWETHVDEEALERYAMGALGEEDEAPIEEHLLLCGGCRNRLTEIDGFLKALRQRPEGTTTPFGKDPRREGSGQGSAWVRRPVE